jgi:hypothetical protein
MGLDTTLSSRKDFNQEVARAIDAAFSEILGEHTLRALYGHLKDHYNIASDEIPYHLPTIIRVLGNIRSGWNQSNRI